MAGLNEINPESIKLDLDSQGYCLDCIINHNCLNCDIMDYLIKFNTKELKIIESDYNKSDKKRYCGCGNIIKGGYRMCSECYFKAKMSGEL